ncbi:MAG TPA: TIGR02099 family protein, partial [Variovorax sp.]
MPRIGDYRSALEAQASRAIGVAVRIGSISARSGSLFPTVELGNVELLDEQGQAALQLDRVVASVSPRSVWNLSFEQLYIERPQVEIRRDAQGRIHIAGLDMGTDASGQDAGADWFFAQREVVVQGGTVRWTDEARNAAALLLTDVSFVSRNSGLGHAMRLDATPPVGWGERMTVRAQFRQPLLSVRSGNWRRWTGQLYADLPYIDATLLGRYIELDARIHEGSGALRLWGDVSDGSLTGGVVDLALTKIDVSLDRALDPLVLRDLTGRLTGKLDDETQAFSTERLQFETAEGMRWPGGNLWLQRTLARGKVVPRGALRADRLDLGALVMIADRLPIGEAIRKLIAAYQPSGLVERIDANWQGPADAS